MFVDAEGHVAGPVEEFGLVVGDAAARAYVHHVRTRRGLAAAFVDGDNQDSAFVTACRAAVGEVATALLGDAQRAGTIRPDLRLDDLLTLVNAIAIVTESSDEHRAEHLLTLVVEGFRPRQGDSATP